MPNLVAVVLRIKYKTSIGFSNKLQQEKHDSHVVFLVWNPIVFVFLYFFTFWCFFKYDLDFRPEVSSREGHINGENWEDYMWSSYVTSTETMTISTPITRKNYYFSFFYLPLNSSWCVIMQMEKLSCHFCTRRCTSCTHYDKRTFVFQKRKQPKKANSPKKQKINSRFVKNPITHCGYITLMSCFTTIIRQPHKLRPGGNKRWLNINFPKKKMILFFFPKNI